MNNKDFKTRLKNAKKEFSEKNPNDKGTPCDLPGNKQVVESKRTGLPLCKNK